MTDLAVGATIELSDGRTGTIRFLGETTFASGPWVGIELPDATGKNNGSVQGERYFDCPMGHGMFVRPNTIAVIAPAPAPAPKAAPPKRPASRPSSMFNAATGRSGADAGLTKRMSLNASSPSPGPRTARVSSISRSPTKSPIKQMVTGNSSASTSRTGTPSTSRAAGVGTKARPSAGGPRTSMGPPPPPGASRTKQSTASSSSTSRTAGPTRTMSGRLSMTAPRAPPRPPSTRNASAESQAALEIATAKGGDEEMVGSHLKDNDILSPQPTSPVAARTSALEKLTTKSDAPAPRTVSTSAGPRTGVNAAAANKELEDLKAKYRVMERKRMEDRDKIKQLEKVQEERDRYQGIIEKLQTKLRPLQEENAELRKQFKEAEQRLESIEGIQADHDEAMEMAALDREMAEETAEVLKSELEALKQKSEELELEVEVLREENEEFSKGLTPEERSSANWMQMERTNERLREALIRLRDLTQQQEEELRDQIKGLEEELRDFGEVKEQYEKSRDKVTETENAVEDLRQQLETALGAEDMIEDLSERHMALTEHVEELKAVIEDLENLKEVNDELEVNHVQNEREMQEEIDFKDSVIAEQARRAAHQDEALEDMEYTLSRFRELVTSLQTDLEDMRASHTTNEIESAQLSSKSRAMMDLNMKLQMSAAKAQTKAVDLELRRLEAQEAEQHLEIIQLFLPESFQTDRDSILALLRFTRLAFKANLLHDFIKERVNGQPHPNHEDDVFAGCEALDKLTWVTSMCDRFVNTISHCSLEHFVKFEGALYELEPIEKSLNMWIDGLRRDDLKEKQCASELQRTIAVMSHLGEVHLEDDLESCADDIRMKTLLMQSELESAATTLTVLRDMVQRAVPASDEDDEVAEHFSKRCDAAITQTRSAKVVAGKALRGLEELKQRSLTLPPESIEAFEECEKGTRELAALCRNSGFDLHALLSEEGRTDPHTYDEIQSTIQSMGKPASGSNDTDLFSSYAAKLRIVTGQITDLAALSSDFSQTQEFERRTAPWILRAQELRALKKIPIDAEEELRHLKEEFNEARRAIALRDENLSTAHLKIETLESRARDAAAKTLRMAELEQLMEEAKQRAASLVDDIEKQDRELKTLESDRDKWKKVAGDSRAFAGAEGGAGAAKAGQERAVATAREMDALKADITSLQAAVRFHREDSRRARTKEQSSYDWLAEPLQKPTPVAEQRRQLVVAEGRDVLGELLRMATSATAYDLGKLPKDKLAWRPAKTTPQYHAAKQMEDYATWKDWQDSVVKKSQVLLGARTTARGEATARRKAAARMQIRLPDLDGKVIPGSGRDVQIVGSRDWEGLQGRLAAV